MKFHNEKNKSIFDKIDAYLCKKGHELVLSVYLANYNDNNIYVRFDYVRKLAAYKVVWVDLNFFNEKHIEDFINMQLVTKYLSIKLVEALNKVDYQNSYSLNDEIKGDRVEVLSYIKEEPREYIFDRFLPLEWSLLIDPLVLLFTYLPRGMEVFLNEMFAKFDKTEEKYSYAKPVRFDLMNGDSLKLFRPASIGVGTELYDKGRVKYLEEGDGKYLAIVEDKGYHVVAIAKEDDEYVSMVCDCKSEYYCKHIYATLLAIRNNKFNSFYKVKYIIKDQTLLEKVTRSDFLYAFGIKNDKMLLLTDDGRIAEVPIRQKNKCVFEVIEDDDDCSLSKKLEEYK